MSHSTERHGAVSAVVGGLHSIDWEAVILELNRKNLAVIRAAQADEDAAKEIEATHQDIAPPTNGKKRRKERQLKRETDDI
jgi:hypothetical protein